MSFSKNSSSCCWNIFDHFLSVSQIDNISFAKLFIFDSSTIRLFSEIMMGVGRNPKNEGRKKGGLKVHIMIDAHSDTPTFVKISEAKSHDKNFMQYLQLALHSMIVFDRAYNHYLQFANWTKQQVWFVCRLKKNAVYEVMQETFKQEMPDGQAGVLKEEHIHLSYKEEKESKTLCLRKVTYSDEKGREYEFITNNFSISNVEVAHVYKLRWNIELLFKKNKAEFSNSLFLFRNREWHKNTSMVHTHRTTATHGIARKIKNKKSIFNRCRIGEDTPHQLFGYVLDG